MRGFIGSEFHTCFLCVDSSATAVDSIVEVKDATAKLGHIHSLSCDGLDLRLSMLWLLHFRHSLKSAVWRADIPEQLLPRSTLHEISLARPLPS